MVPDRATLPNLGFLRRPHTMAAVEDQEEINTPPGNSLNCRMKPTKLWSAASHICDHTLTAIVYLC